MGIARTVLGLAIIIGAAWDGLVFGGVYATNAFNPPLGSTFEYGSFALYLTLGVILAVAGIFLVMIGNWKNESATAKVEA